MPFAAGGNADFVARLVGEGMSQALGQPIVVESRAGAGGSLGAAGGRDARAPDGYTLLTGSNGPLTVNPFVQAKLSYDPLKDFVADRACQPGAASIVLHDSVPAKTRAGTDRAVEAAADHDRHAGVGSATHMTLARFNAATGANFVARAVSRRRRAGARRAGRERCRGAMTEMSTALPHHNQGKVRILAVASAKRSPQAPDVPTMIECGVKDFTAASYVGVLAPAKTPPEVVAVLEKALIKALADKATQDKFMATRRRAGAAKRCRPPRALRDYIKREFEELAGGREDRRPHAAVTNSREAMSGGAASAAPEPAATRTLVHLANSSAMNASNASGVELFTTTPALVRRSRIAGSCENFVERLVELGDRPAGGMPFGPNRPYQVVTS